MTTFRCWIVTGGRSEWQLIEAESLEAAEKAAQKKFKHKLVSVRTIPKRDAA